MTSLYVPGTDERDLKKVIMSLQQLATLGYYKQTETGAISSPLISRFSNTLYAHEFGCVGDGVTNDVANFQLFLTAVATSGKEGRLDPGATYYFSGADPTLALPSGAPNVAIYGNGARIKTNGAQFRTALRIANATAVTRQDETRQILIEGLTIDQVGLVSALYGIDIVGSPHVTLRDISFQAGSDTATVNAPGYAQLHFGQSDTTDPNKSAFWCRVENCRFEGGANYTPYCIQIEGGHNGINISRSVFANADKGIQFLRAQAGADGNSAVIANGVRIDNNDFEAVNYGIHIQGTSGWSSLNGLLVHHNRVEAIGNYFFSNTLDLDNSRPPIIGPNDISSGDYAKYIFNPSSLKLDVRDEFIGKVTFDPASLAAGATRAETGNTIAITPANTTDRVTVQSSADLQGITATAYVSASNTVTIRLTNPTSGAIDLGSTTFTARVRPYY